MRQVLAHLQLSSTDLANHLACTHLSSLELRVAKRELARPIWHDPAADLLRQRGLEHERAFVAHLCSTGKRVVDLAGAMGEEAVRRTLEAARAGVDVIVQAALSDGRWHGRADVLERAERPSRLGAWSYDVLDTKLAQETRGGTVLQLCVYADLLAALQGEPAERMAVVKPGSGFPSEDFRFAEYAAYYRLLKRRLEEFVDRGGGAETYPEPVPHCDICRWWQRCDERRHADDHLSLVAGMRGLHARELVRQGIGTLAALAQARPVLREAPLHGRREAFERLQAQASIQLRGRDSKRPVSELLPFEAGRGLARLPAPCAGDVFLDFEGDPFVPAAPGAPGGLEYLLGYATFEDGEEPRYVALWALDRAAEKRALETFLDFVLARLERHEGLHVYHYGSYEPAALKRLASRHATRERELDVLLRGERFVDLHRVTRQGVLASVESYSLKPLEEHFGYTRGVKLREEASPALRRVSSALELGTPQAITPADRAAVEGYNRDDCVSLVELRAWLEQKREQLAAETPGLERPPLKDGRVSEDREERDGELRQLFDALVAGVPVDPNARTEEQRARWLLAHMIDYFQREERVSWWEYFARREMDDEELRGERKALFGLELVEELPKQGREQTPTHRYRFEPQEAAFDEGDDICDPRAALAADGEKNGDHVGRVASFDPAQGTIDIKKTRKWASRHPTAIHVNEHVPSKALQDALHELVRWVAQHGIDTGAPEHRAARDLLLRLPPRMRASMHEPMHDAGHKSARAPLASAGEPPLDAGLRVARELEGGLLALQGPPGAGKTFVGARMIASLARDGRRVGVSAVSHRVVRKLLEDVLRAADELSLDLHVTHKPSSRVPADPPSHPRFHHADEAPGALAALDAGHVVGGVAWLWTASEAERKLDYLFLDEAGQMSLAQVLACARSARNLILLGDPQQLEQPQRGAHPEGADVSALNHLLGKHATMPPELGLFLAETWRLPPAMASFTSELFYEGRLASRPGCERQRLAGPTPFAGAGLFLVPVEHAGNASSSREEVETVRRVVDGLLCAGVTWTDRAGRVRELTEGDLLVIAPYNAQVAALSRAARADRRKLEIGTVDRFQGQEAPVVLCSLASSTARDAPRGLSFLYDLHRLNVATSRARCACILIASPALFEPECRTPEEMRLANALCAYRDRARVVAV